MLDPPVPEWRFNRAPLTRPSPRCGDFLRSLSRKGVRVWLEKEQLHYRASRGTLTRADLATLGSMKSEIMTFLKASCSVTVEPLIRHQGELKLAPLTVQQHSLWNELQRGGVSYRHPAALRLSGELHLELLRKSFEAVIRRHDSLRTRIAVLDGAPVQQICEPSAYRLNVTDCAGVDPKDIGRRIQEAIHEATHQGCDLAEEPLFDVRLLKLGEADHLLLWAIHHMVSDGVSSVLVLREVWLTYAALMQRGPELRDLPTQYADYARWQHSAQQTWLERNGAYWEEVIAGATGIRWPADGRSDEEARNTGVEVGVEFGKTLTKSLRELAASSGTTLALASFTIYNAVVARWCHQDDFIVATAVTGRDRSDLEGMTGYCAHDVYLRIHLSRETTFLDLLRQVTRTFQQTIQHPDFGRTVASAPDLLAHTLFQWMPWEDNEHDGVPDAALSQALGLKVERHPAPFVLGGPSPFSQYDLMTVFSETEQGVVGRIGCRASLFVGDTVRRLADDLLRAAQQFVQAPASPVLP